MTKFNNLIWGIIAAITLTLGGCRITGSEEVSISGDDILVINEGNFSSADGSLSTYNSFRQTATLGVFEQANGFPLGGIVQNATLHNGNLYLTTNVADKLEVINPSNFRSIASLRNTPQRTRFVSPFAFAAVGNKGYVSNWGTFNSTTFSFEKSFITRINLQTNTVIDSLPRNVQPQHLLAVGQNIYISNVGGNTISVLNTANDQFIAEITVPAGPDKMVLDRAGRIWVLCNSGALARINPNTNVVEATFNNVPNLGFNEKMVINRAGDRLFWLNGSFSSPSVKVFAMDINASQVPTQPIITRDNLYGIGIDNADVLYLGDSKAFQGNGTVYRYSTTGTGLTEFGAGRAPNGFVILR